MPKRRWIWWVAACVVLLAACSSSSSSTGGAGPQLSATGGASVGPPAQGGGDGSTASALAGRWKGTWTNTSGDAASGSFQIDWTQHGSKLAGTIAITGTPCLTGGHITGTVKGSAIDFGVVSGTYQVDYKGSLSGADMSGSYSTDCGNGKGTWEATKSS
ncbi:MAG: hypothetical protein QOI60_1533 [Actinomycetota bacterium]|jgi:hypothetical protein|nr:hypothetical protein [Actinomycetota bacterium]